MDMSIHNAKMSEHFINVQVLRQEEQVCIGITTDFHAKTEMEFTKIDHGKLLFKLLNE